MKPYTLSYVSKLPEGRGGEARMWRIRILQKHHAHS